MSRIFGHHLTSQMSDASLGVRLINSSWKSLYIVPEAPNLTNPTTSPAYWEGVDLKQHTSLDIYVHIRSNPKPSNSHQSRFRLGFPTKYGIIQKVTVTGAGG